TKTNLIPYTSLHDDHPILAISQIQDTPRFTGTKKLNTITGFTNTGKDLVGRRAKAKMVAGIHVNKGRDMEDFLRLRLNILCSTRSEEHTSELQLREYIVCR